MSNGLNTWEKHSIIFVCRAKLRMFNAIVYLDLSSILVYSYCNFSLISFPIFTFIRISLHYLFHFDFLKLRLKIQGKEKVDPVAMCMPALIPSLENLHASFLFLDICYRNRWAMPKETQRKPEVVENCWPRH